MTEAEREDRAVAEHRCPRCHIPRMNRCRTTDEERAIMEHPHPERVKLVQAPACNPRSPVPRL